MGRMDEISYYIDTFFDTIEKLKAKWRYLSWETKVRVKGILSVLGLGLAYIIYSRAWVSLPGLGKAGLLLYVLLVLGLFVSTLLEVLDLSTFKH